ncbi:replication factor A protein 3 [Aspergillus avenaceus]|uniref:Replication factor A protein 3 n=1 Tax=Aspergillus avenaceus TaxID=36643 RepID=A0A5N6TF05_ASPAV|nr:replication factor A protein 3 [Aspergillus avenaceus]
MSLQTPRVLPAHLHAFHPSNASAHVTNTVRILGTVTALRGDTATITCGNNGDVTLILKPDSHLQMGRLVEVVGKVADVDQGLGIRVLGTTDWGNPADCDYKIYENVVNATHRFKSVFYDA